MDTRSFKNMKKTTFLLAGLLCSIALYAQIGGRGVFQSLGLPPSARTAALGGYQIAVYDNEMTLGFQNPALLNPEMDRQMTFNQVNYLADINFGYAGYGHTINDKTTVLGGVQYVNFGEFIEADEFGTILGTFSGGEAAVTMGGSYAWKYNLSFGANLKFIYSNLAGFNSYGVAMDLGATHNWKEKQLVSSLVIRHLGTQLKSYSGNRENLPLDIQLGFSKRLANAPLRVNITAHHLNIPDISYINTNNETTIDLETGEPIVDSVSLGDKIMRHFIVGGEILLSKNFHLRIGYNHQRRRELTLERAKGGVGYTMGFGLRIWRFHVDYARAAYHVAGASHHFSVTSNLSSWMKRKEVSPES